jgi:dipeptidyl aminopeptidase/acylaminoacyl peptidase
MPDIVYQIGRPGMSAVKCVVPAVQRLIDDGIADAGRVGLCGHSWGGYETAYIITQTRLFAAAVAGAPVVDMISAYNGIRWSTGLPRQFQYERTQSRIGGSLWEYPERFLENSAIFHLPNVVTPVLIMFGNNDGAVPWWQGVEYYLGMRRLGKPAVLLEYKDEGHGLRGKANQEDYTRRLMEWFDHYLKGTPPAEWIQGQTVPSPLDDAPLAPAPAPPPPAVIPTPVASVSGDPGR